MCWLKCFSFPFLFILLVLITYCQFYVDRPELQYKKWVVSEPLLTKGPSGTFDDAAVKDPSIVYYKGKYHLFYTSKSTKSTRESLKYVGNVPLFTTRDIETMKKELLTKIDTAEVEKMETDFREMMKDFE